MSGDKFYCVYCNSRPTKVVIKDNLYHCPSCNKHADYIDILMKVKKLSRDEALESIGELPDVKPIVAVDSPSELGMDFFKFCSVEEELLDLYDVYIRDDIIYYPCANNVVVFHRALPAGRIQWLHQTDSNVFGLKQVALDCTEIYVTENIMDVFFFRREGKNAVALLEFNQVVDGISELPKHVSKYIFSLDKSRAMPVLDHFFNNGSGSQTYSFYIDKDGGMVEVDYEGFIESDISSEKDHIICLKKIDSYRKMTKYSPIEVNQRVTNVLNYTVDIVNNRTFPIENTESGLLNIALHNHKYLERLMVCYDFFHKDTQKILDYVKEMAVNQAMTLPVVNQALLSSHDDNLRNRYKLLSDMSSDIDESLFNVLLLNLTYFGCKRSTQHYVYSTTDDTRDSFRNMSDFFIEIGLKIGTIDNSIHEGSFDHESCVDNHMMAAYDTELGDSLTIVTGIKLLDEVIRFATRTVTTIIGHSGEGKSIFLVNVLLRLMNNNPNIYVLWIDLEMTLIDLQDRVYRACIGDVGTIVDGWEEDYPAIKRISLIAGSRPWGNISSVSLKDIVNKIKLMITLHRKKDKNLTMVVIDHIHQIGGADTNDAGTIMRSIALELPAIARRENISMVLVAQLNKANSHIEHWESLMPSVDNIHYGNSLKMVTNSCVSVCSLEHRLGEMKRGGFIKEKKFNQGPLSMYSDNKLHIGVSKFRSGKGGAVIEYRCNKAAYKVFLDDGEIVS